MQTRIPYPALLLLAVALLAANAAAFAYAFRHEESSVLSVAFLDVGQGDSVLVKGPTGIEMLIDGGKDRSVLRELPRSMGPFDRTIDLVVATHPDADHIGGLPDVLSRYQVAHVLESGRAGDSSQADRLADAVEKERGASHAEARRGMRIHLGDGAYADILHPEDNVAKLPGTNDASVVIRLVYGETEFMLTGDAPAWVEDRLSEEYGDTLRSDVLKAGHHGSKTSTSARFLETVDPSMVVISAGEDNSYGHPHPDVLDRIRESGATPLTTIDEGTITLVSDGTTVRRK